MIRVEGLVKRFGDRTVLDRIDLDIATGERIVVIGPSGTGKSTLLRCLNFLDPPDCGRISLSDLSVDAETASRAEILALRRRTAFVFQNYALFANRTAHGNLTEALVTVQRRPAAEARARADAILAEIGLADRVLFMDGGRIVEQGPPAAIFETPRDPRLQAFLRRVG